MSSHDLFLEEGGYGCHVFLGDAPTWSPSWVAFSRAKDVRDSASGPAFRQVVKGPFASREEALSACTALIFKAVKEGTTGL